MGNEIVDPTSPPVMLHCPKPLIKSLSVHIERGGETSEEYGRYAQVELKEKKDLREVGYRTPMDPERPISPIPKRETKGSAT